MNGRDMFEADSNSASYNPSHMSSEWRFWGDYRVDPLINVQNQLDYSISTNGEQAGFGGIDAIASGSNSNSMAMIPLKPMLKEAQVLPNAPGIVPSELPQLPADSGFIGRPAWFSSFSDENLGVMMNTPLAISESMSLCSGDGNVIQGPQDAFLQAWPMQSYKNDRNFDKNSRGRCPGMESTGSEVYWIKNKERISVYAKSDEETKQHGLATGNEPDDNEFTDVNGPEETSNVKAKNRKRICQGVESGFLNVAEENSEAVKDAAEEKEKNEPNLKSTAADKSAGKQEQPGPEASNSPSAEYIHVRARRGQATNSHSLAERVRREKISDRMKLLQDIVPGCNKVSGKAVMLDEIINYVQSLQHQVEFLSMKLATVNPSLNNTETLHLQPGSSSRPGIFQALPMPQPVFFNPNFNSTPCFRLRSINPQLTSLNQPSVWEDELGNVAHMIGGVTHYRHTNTHTDLRHLGT